MAAVARLEEGTKRTSMSTRPAALPKILLQGVGGWLGGVGSEGPRAACVRSEGVRDRVQQESDARGACACRSVGPR